MVYKTYSELFDQYSALQQTLQEIDQRQLPIRTVFEQASAETVVFTGCGSSYSLCRALADCVQPLLNIPVLAVAGGDLMLHMDQWASVFSRPALLVPLSRSGSTHEVLYVIEQLKDLFPLVKVLSFICTVGSNVAIQSDCSVELPWTFDESVCQTRSVTNLFCGALSAFATLTNCKEITASLHVLAEQGEQYLSKIENTAEMLADTAWENVMVLCDGGGFGVAEEAALAFNEIAFIHSACKHVLDVRHGPIVLIDKLTLVLAKLTKAGFNYEKKLVEDLIQRGAQVVAISDEPLPVLEGVSAQLAFGHPLHDAVSALLLLNVAQLISYYRAIAQGLNPDGPAGLDAWITLS